MSHKKLALAAAAAIFAGALTPAFAGQSAVTRTIAIDVSGLDVTTEQGASLIQAKIRRAAKEVCDYRSGPMTISERRVRVACFNAAISDAHASLGRTGSLQADTQDRTQG